MIVIYCFAYKYSQSATNLWPIGVSANITIFCFPAINNAAFLKKHRNDDKCRATAAKSPSSAAESPSHLVKSRQNVINICFLARTMFVGMCTTFRSVSTIRKTGFMLFRTTAMVQGRSRYRPTGGSAAGGAERAIIRVAGRACAKPPRRIASRSG